MSSHRFLFGPIYFAVALICAPLGFAETPSTFNPRPLPDDLVLPMPNGASMVFRPVFLGIGDDKLAEKTFKMGDRTGGNYKEKVTEVTFGGSFVADNQGHKDWLFYIGKYEVSRGQFAAFHASPAGAVIAEQSSVPQTDVTHADVEKFINDYNAWLRTNAPASLPHYDETVGFLRLPTEQEWEFAARGGTAVEPARFEQPTPYGDELAKYEWFAGPRSSFDKLKEIGTLAPNPLGIHDMLGNAAEMTNTPYQLQIGQGRIGGYSVRGGSYRTPAEEIRSSLRIEQPLFGRDQQPSHDETIGFRLVIASQVITDQNRSQLEAAAAQQNADGLAGEKAKADEVAKLADEKRKLEVEAAAGKARADEAERLAAEKSKQLDALMLAEEKRKADEAKQNSEEKNARTQETQPVAPKSRTAELSHSVTFTLESIRRTTEQTIAVNGSLTNKLSVPATIYCGDFTDERYPVEKYGTYNNQYLQATAVDQIGNRFVYRSADGFTIAESSYGLKRPAIYLGRNQFVSVAPGDSSPVTLYLAPKNQIQGTSKSVDLHIEFLMFIGDSPRPSNKTIGFRACAVE